MNETTVIDNTVIATDDGSNMVILPLDNLNNS